MSRTWIVDVRGKKRSLRRLFLLSISLCDVLISTSCSTFANAHRLFSTYVVGCLLIFIPLLVLSSLGLIWSTLLVIQCLPSLAEDLADLTCKSSASAGGKQMVPCRFIPKLMPGFSSRTFSRCSFAKNM